VNVFRRLADAFRRLVDAFRRLVDAFRHLVYTFRPRKAITKERNYPKNASNPFKSFGSYPKNSTRQNKKSLRIYPNQKAVKSCCLCFYKQNPETFA